jgi:putative pyruvate formate lyase activating enzyme
LNIRKCDICPRKCGADRTVSAGFCGGGSAVRAAKAYLHMWEEPCISGTNGSGTVFFSGCNLKCCYCQNYNISAENFGQEITTSRLAEIFLELQEQKAHNINLVNPTHYVPWIIEALDMVKHSLHIPVVYNCGGYEAVETLKLLDGYIDIYLPDFKYCSSEIAMKYSNAADYFDVIIKALPEMLRQVGFVCLDDSGIAKKGLIVRHLVLPGCRHDSVDVLHAIADVLPKEQIFLSLMSQYTPFYKSCEHKEISRRISSFEYNFVADKALSLGFNGYMQEKSSAKEEYTPIFDLSGITNKAAT